LENSYELPPAQGEPVLLVEGREEERSSGGHKEERSSGDGETQTVTVWKLRSANSVHTESILPRHIMRGRREEYIKRGEDAARSCRLPGTFLLSPPITVGGGSMPAVQVSDQAPQVFQASVVSRPQLGTVTPAQGQVVQAGDFRVRRNQESRIVPHNWTAGPGTGNEDLELASAGEVVELVSGSFKGQVRARLECEGRRLRHEA